MEYNRAFFKDKVCAVTGGASGIGLALCEELLGSGAKAVTLADFNKEKLAAEVERLEKEYPGRVQGVLCNVTIEADVAKMVDEAAAFAGGRLDLLINCAGAAFASTFLERDGLPVKIKSSTNEAWKNAFALNFYGAVYGARAALKYMLGQKSGQVVNIISGIAFSPMAFQCMYAATKAALCALTQSLRYEFWDYGVRFIASTPGTTATAIFDVAGGPPPEAQSPHQSAQRILRGVANNERLIMGDDADVYGGKTAFIPDGGNASSDKVYAGFARQRRSGTVSFVAEEDGGKSTPATKTDTAFVEFYAKFKAAPAGQKSIIAREYFATRPAKALDKAYYEGKTALVTGGASGVGLALCEKLLECGAKKVVLADFNEENLKKEEARLEAAYPGRVKGIVANVASEDDVKNMIEKACEFFDGSFDILINCAGVGQRGMFAETPDAEEVMEKTGMRVETQEVWDKVYGVDFYGPVYGCRWALPIMIKQGYGQIINICSGMAYTPMPFEGIYASAKAALNMLTLALRYEYFDTGVKINSATPGCVATPIFGKIKAPKNAQSPESSAIRILTGAAKNERFICGDDQDLETMLFTFDIDYNDVWDDMLHDIARVRREGDGSFYGKF